MTIDVPGGIDDASNRALTQLINERFDGLQTENVLVWFLAGQTQEQLVLAAELLGLMGPEFGGGAPTVDILKQGVLLRLRKGTPDALEQVLASLLYDESALDEEAFKYCDGTWDLSGEWRLGADRSPKFFQIYFNLTATLTVAEQQKRWDAVQRWSRPGCAFAIGFRQAGQPTVMIRARSEIASDLVPGAAPTASALSYTQVDTAGGGQDIVLTGSDLADATALEVGDLGVWTAASITATTSGTVSFQAPPKVAGTYDVRVTTPAGSATLAAALEYWDPTQVTAVDEVFDSNKGVTAPAGAVGTWTGQKNSVACTQATGANKPTQVANVFGSLPSIRFVKENTLAAASGRLLATGASFFAVAKWTSTDATPAQPALNVALTIVGWNNGSCWGSFGAAAGVIAHRSYNQAGNTSDLCTRGSGLNDGNARLIGITHDTSQNVKAYVDTTQQGTTQVFTASYPSSFLKWGDLGNGYLSADGFVGDIGAIVIIAGVISAGDLTKLNKWAQQRFGTP